KVPSDGTGALTSTHYEWDTRFTANNPAGAEFCYDMTQPYDFSASIGADTGLSTRAEVLAVDNFGRVTDVLRRNDNSPTANKDADDLCVHTDYAQSGNENSNAARVLSAVSLRKVTDYTATSPTSCIPSGVTFKTLAKQSWTYDGLAAGSVSNGFVTGHTVSRLDENGNDTLGGDITDFSASYDSAGRLINTTTTRREDGATRTVTPTYDPTPTGVFGLLPISVKTTATNVADTTVSFTYDPI